MQLLSKYFPGITEDQMAQFNRLSIAVRSWNEKINVISRKDLDHLEERHILHSLAIAKFIEFRPGTSIIDVGTGGGFPGLPLAILFPECRFTLVDSIAKKIRVVGELTAATGLQNVSSFQERAEKVDQKFEFVVSRAVTAFPKFYSWTKHMTSKEQRNKLPNGIIALKGGDLGQELGGFGKRIATRNLNDWFDEEWFSTKKLVYLNI